MTLQRNRNGISKSNAPDMAGIYVIQNKKMVLEIFKQIEAI